MSIIKAIVIKEVVSQAQVVLTICPHFYRHGDRKKNDVPSLLRILHLLS